MNTHETFKRTELRCLRLLVWLSATFLVSLSLKAQDERTLYFPKTRDYAKSIPARENVWIFVLAGQSNMAGRGLIQPSDTMPNNRILTINAVNELIVAKEPLHFYEPNLTGLDCGMSFANRLLQGVEKEITVLLVPTAVGGSSSHQWLGDSVHREVKLMTNFRKRVSSVAKYGTIKAVLWHQGESDTNDKNIPGYAQRLAKIYEEFRMICGDPTLPILIGNLGSYSENQLRWNAVNAAIEEYASSDKNAFVIETFDLKSKADKIHFDAAGQRTMGIRMAETFLKISQQATK
jgi:hypothetical protein